jgi:peptidoglycan hydrolase-like protein with peptidoglycan-binding domain
VETTPGSTAQSEKDTAAGNQARQAGSGSETSVSSSAQSGDASKAGRDLSSASEAQGMSGQQDVRQAQQALKNQGQDPGPIDGILGPQTRQALRGFQKANGLEQTGTLDAETKQKLNIDGASSGASGSASGSGLKEPSSSPISK